ncbi:MAG: hypothetical protein HOP30_12220 [Cyclobacteriaceae bacterium]|nr:hypothetical protein [Cyclobacteriaceae bacterium]
MNATISPTYFIFKLEEFRATIGDDDGLGKKILTLVLTELPARIQNIQNSLNQPDISLLRKEIHDLKGIVGLLGCAGLYQQLTELKLTEGASDPTRLLNLYSVLERLKMLEKDLLRFSKMELLS